MRNLTLTIQFSDISQSFVSATKYENTSLCSNENLEQISKNIFKQYVDIEVDMVEANKF
jgi:hypothetical protein